MPARKYFEQLRSGQDIPHRGFTLIETLIGLGVFAVVATSLYFAYSNVLDIMTASSQNAATMAIINSEIEMIRNMKYEDVGTIGGVPAGKLLQSRTVTIDGAPFQLATTVRNIDDPFDGTLGGAPNDLAPADYRLVELEVVCPQCAKFLPIKMTTTVAPRNLEGATKNGALFVTILDANGQPVAGASVHIVNTLVSPQINLTDVTNSNGQLQLVDTATSSFGYQVTASKTGYSTDKTYLLGAPANPNPVHPHATVAKQQITNLSLSIDRVSTLNFKTTDEFCVPVPDVSFLQKGMKLIGTDPDTLKFSATQSTDAGGLKTISNLEWDNYSFTNLSATHAISGATTLGPLIVNPAQTHTVTWNMEPAVPSALFVMLSDADGQPVSGATVTMGKNEFLATQIAGRRSTEETDWSAGNYSAKSAGIDPDSQPGRLTLAMTDGKYSSSSQEWLTSETIDFGTAQTTFYTLAWNPGSQPPETGADSLQVQVAANNDNSTWNFVGPDGTGGTYFTASGTALPAGLNNNRYFRYKVFMRTIDHFFTPALEDISLLFSSDCFPSNQAYFSGLEAGTYKLTATKTGYADFTDMNVVINADWQPYTATMTP